MTAESSGQLAFHHRGAWGQHTRTHRRADRYSTQIIDTVVLTDSPSSPDTSDCPLHVPAEPMTTQSPPGTSNPKSAAWTVPVGSAPSTPTSAAAKMSTRIVFDHGEPSLSSTVPSTWRTLAQAITVAKRNM